MRVDYLNPAGAIYLNGDLLQRDAHLTEPLSRTWHTPRFLPLPASLLKPEGENVLLLRVSGLAIYQPGVGAVTVGAAPAVQAMHEQMLQLRDLWRWFNLATAVVLSILFLALWLMYRQERSYGWFSLNSAVWACVIVNGVSVSTWPFASTDAYEAAVLIAWALSIGTFPAFTLSFAERKAPRLMAAVWVVVACLVLAMLLAVHLQSPAAIVGARIAVALVSPLSIVAFSLWFMFFTPNSRHNGYGVMKIGMAFMVLGVVYEHIDPPEILTRIMEYTGGPLQVIMATMALTLAWRFADSRRQIEGFNDELKTRVAAAQAERDQTLRRQHELEIANARLHERVTLVNDLHDGLGGTLINNIVVLEQSPRDAAAEHFLSVLRDLRDELHDIIETVATESFTALSLDELIAPLRHRITQLFEARGVDCRWLLPDQPVHLHDARTSAEVMRLLQEGLTNALRHSGANNVTVCFEVDGTTLRLSITDDGHGFDPAAVSPGLGLNSLRTRIARLGGTLAIHSSPQGTQLKFEIPQVVVVPA
jgi:signal transduction histidine kinase